MTLPEIRRLPSPAMQPREALASVSVRHGNSALPAASFGVVRPRAMASAPAVTMKMPR